MYGKIKEHLQKELADVDAAGLFKRERVITTPQGADVQVNSGDDVIIMCANNYLGLSSHPDVIQASKNTLDSHGFGMSSVRFICGTQDIHKELDKLFACQDHLRFSKIFVYFFVYTNSINHLKKDQIFSS